MFPNRIPPSSSLPVDASGRLAPRTPAVPTSGAPALGTPVHDGVGPVGDPWAAPAWPGTPVAALVDPLALAPNALAQADRLDPPMLCCPLSTQVLEGAPGLMSEPVLAADGYTYERRAYDAWVDRCGLRSPVTGHPLCAPTEALPDRCLGQAIAALQAWRAAGCSDDLRQRLRPAITDPCGQHHAMRHPMTLSDGSTVDARNLASLFERYPVRSPLTGQLWPLGAATVRCNRALQALSAAVEGFVPSAFPARQSYATYALPRLDVPPPSAQLAYRNFCCDYSGLTWPGGAFFGACAGLGVGMGVGFGGLGSGVGGCVGLCVGTCAGVTGVARAVDYPRYLAAQREAACRYDEAVARAYATYNDQRRSLQLAPVQASIQR